MLAIISKIKSAKCPVLIAGHGIRLAGAKEELLKFLEHTKMPVCVTFLGKDLVPTNHPQNLGPFGILGCLKANTAIHNADLILSIGARMKLQNITFDYDNFAPHAYKISVDIDEKELNKKTYVPNEKIHEDCKEFLCSLLKHFSKS